MTSRFSPIALLFCSAVLLGSANVSGSEPALPEGVRVLARNPDAGGPPGLRPEDLGPLFDDPQLQSALRRLEGGRSGVAPELLSEWLEENPRSPHRDKAIFARAYALYVGERWVEARSALRQCVEEAPLFEDYCLYWGADVAFRAEEYALAEAQASIVPRQAVYGPRSQFLAARAMMQAGNVAGAIDKMEEFLAAWPGAWYRNEVEFELAAAYEARGDWDEAAHVYHRVAVVNPGSAAETRAGRALTAIRDRLTPSVRTQVQDRSSSETLSRGRILFDRHRSEQVIELLGPVVSNTRTGSTVWCEAQYLIGKSWSKLRQHRNSMPPYLAVIEHCDSEDLVVKALYNAGRGAWNIDDDDHAIALFEQLWTRYPGNSYADDAMLLAARVKRSNQDEAGFTALLEQQIQEFPTGDMLGEAVWLLASKRFQAGDHRGLITFVDRVGTRNGETDIYSRGRLGYYRALSLEALSRTAEAQAAYSHVARDNPMAYYAFLALNRLRDMDADRTQTLLEELAHQDSGSDGRITIQPPEAAQDPHFLRARAMLRLGLYTLAQGEFDKLQARFSNEDEIGWVVASLYHHVGAYERSHHVPGDRLTLRLGYPTEANRERWEIAYPTPFEELVQDAAETRNLDAWWVYAIMREESGFRPTIESWANARGLLQLMEGTANDMARITGRGSIRASDLFDPAINIELGTQFMRTLADRFASHPALIFAGYNGGHGNVNRWLRERGELPLDLWVEEIPYDQTRNYVKRVTMTWWVYHWMQGDYLPAIGWSVQGI